MGPGLGTNFPNLTKLTLLPPPERLHSKFPRTTPRLDIVRQPVRPLISKAAFTEGILSFVSGSLLINCINSVREPRSGLFTGIFRSKMTLKRIMREIGT